MNANMVNAIYQYLDLLRQCNENFSKLCVAVLENKNEDQEIFENLLRTIMRIMPVKLCPKSKELKLVKRDGLLEFSKEINYLYGDYEKILQNNRRCLEDVRKLRGKVEHRLQAVEHKSTRFSERFFVYVYKVKYKEEFHDVTIDSNSIINLLKDLNELFAKLVYDSSVFMEANGYSEYPIYDNVCNMNFEEWNCKLEEYRKI